MITIDKLCYQSRLRYVNASEKFAYATITLVLSVVSRSLAAAGIIFLTNGILTVGKGGISLSRYIKMFFIPAAFLLLSTVTIMVNISRTPMDAFALSVGGWYLTGSWESVRQGLQLCGIALSAVSCLYFLSLNTTMTDILGVLKKLHVPGLLIELMLLIYRFIFVLLETASAIRISQESRLGNRSYRTSLRSFGEMSAALFILALKRSGAIYNAMESRCYDGKIRVLTEDRPAKGREITAIVLFELILLLVIVAGW